MKYAQDTYIDWKSDKGQDLPDWPMQPGMKVICSNLEGGWKEGFRGSLVSGAIYTLKNVWVGRSNTDVELEEINGKFNSVYFRVIEIKEPLEKKLEEELARVRKHLSESIENELTNLILENAWDLARKDVNVMEPKEVTMEQIDGLLEQFGYRGVYFECNSGWDRIVKPLVDFVLDNGGKVDQVKEKFGGLRFYYTPPEGEWESTKWRDFSKEVSKAEDESYQTCEFTGTPGRLRTKVKGGWLKTLCDEKAEEFGYDRVVDTPF